MAKTKSQKSERPLTLHGLLGALSYWGTGARLFLMTVIAATVYALNVMFDPTASFVTSETMMLFYTLGAIFVMDFCFVLIARARPFRRRFDQLYIVIADVFITGLYVAPSLFIMSDRFGLLRYGALLFALFVIASRYLVGELYLSGNDHKSKK